MPIRSGTMHRPNGFRCGSTLRQRYDEVGLPCSSTMGSPCPTSTYAISLPRTRRRCFWYGNAAEIVLPSLSLFGISSLLLVVWDIMTHSFQVGGSPTKPDISGGCRATYAKLVHPVNQRGSLHAQAFGRAIAAADHPIARFQRAENVISL